MARRKKQAVDAPQTMAEAVFIAEEYAKLERANAKADATCDSQIDEAKARRDEIIAENKPLIDAKFDQLQAYYSVNMECLTDSKRRSVELGPITIGERLTTGKLKNPKGMKVPAAIALLMSIRGGAKKYLKIKTSIDKPAVMKALKDAPKGTLAKRGFSISQKDEFFVKLPEEESSEAAS
jgi:phage host-nuclease inhibitor protein Gam